MSINVPPFPRANHLITLEVAIKMTQLYRQENEDILDPIMRNNGILPLSETFNREAFDNLLAQEGCEGIRLYYSMDADKKVHIIAVAVNNENVDIISAGAEMLIENGIRCPTVCPPASELNS